MIYSQDDSQKYDYSHYSLSVVGSTVKIMEMEKPMYIGPRSSDRKPRRKRVDIVDDPNKEPKKKSTYKAKRRLQDLINHNAYRYFDENGKVFLPVFLTLTPADNLTDIDMLCKELRLFIKRLNYEIYDDKVASLKWVAVIEFQDRGAIHFHLILFNMPYLNNDIIAEIWGLGFINIHSIQTVKNLGKYMTKYMIKNADDERLNGKPSYFIARNLLRPSKINHEILVGQVMDYLPSELMVKGIVIPRNRAEGEFIDGKQVVDHTGQKVITYYDLADRPDILKKVYDVLDEADNSRNEFLASQKQAAEERLAEIMAIQSPKPKSNQPLLPPSSPANHPDF